MATTSYSPLPSSSYPGLGSQGDLFHSANYGAYDTGIGSITSHPYQYETTNYRSHLTDSHQHSSYADDFLRSNHSNNGYSTQQPQYHPTDRYAQQPTYTEDSTFNDYTNAETRRYNDENYPPPTTTVNTIPPPKHKPTVDNHHVESNNQQQTSHVDKTQQHSPISTDIPPHKTQVPPAQVTRVQSEQNKPNHSPPGKQPKQHHRHQSQPPTQTNHSRSEPQNSKQVPPVRHRSPSNDRNDPPSATTGKATNPPPPPPPEMKTTKSTKMRAAAIKQKEETREEKHKNGNFPVPKKKSTPPKSQPHPTTDDEHNEKKKIPKRDKKQSHSLPKQRKSRRDDYQTEDNNSSPDEDIHDQHSRSKSKKHTAFSDPHHEKYPPLPPVRRGRGPPFYDPAYDYPYPPGHPIRPRYPYYDDYPPYPYPHPHRYRPLYEDTYDAPPYVAGYPDPYDGIFDYEKHKSKTKVKKHKNKKELTTDHEDHDGITGNETEREDDKKSPQSKKSRNTKKSIKDDDNDNDNDENVYERRPHKSYDAPYYDDGDMLEIWRQERNDYYKKKFKPTVHDVLYAQQFMKSDSYLENQRRRALRDTQGFYFPYKKYTLKDYKDLQKQEAQHNPYASINDATLDRKERAKKRQEYASHLERHIENPPGQQKTPRDMPPRKPWHSSNGEPQDGEKSSKRERALEYAKVQVVKKQAQKGPKNRSSGPDPTEQYVNSLFPQAHNDDEDNQSSENDDQ